MPTLRRLRRWPSGSGVRGDGAGRTAGEVSVYRAKAPVKVSPASSTSTTTTTNGTHIPALSNEFVASRACADARANGLAGAFQPRSGR